MPQNLLIVFWCCDILTAFTENTKFTFWGNLSVFHQVYSYNTHSQESMSKFRVETNLFSYASIQRGLTYGEIAAEWERGRGRTEDQLIERLETQMKPNYVEILVSGSARDRLNYPLMLARCRRIRKQNSL